MLFYQPKSFLYFFFNRLNVKNTLAFHQVSCLLNFSKSEAKTSRLFERSKV